MSCRDGARLPLPTEPEISWAPERPILALLDANLVLAARTLNAQHPGFDPTDDRATAPLLLVARSIITMAASLRELLAGYHDLAECLTEIDNAPPPRGTPGTDDEAIF